MVEGDCVMNPSRPETPPRSPLVRIERRPGILDAILAASPDLVYLCSRSGEFLFANPSGASVWGLDRFEIL
jgi:PAS domain-containing protein